MSSLKPYQVVNHFKEARHITTKSGLLRTLRMLPWYAPYSSDGYVPLAVRFPLACSLAGSAVVVDLFLEEVSWFVDSHNACGWRWVAASSRAVTTCMRPGASRASR
jgi:hypothetical protein